jgi:hypothetical protein
MTDAPVVVLGVSRSGTTLLKQMLDRHPQLAIPTESYFLPQLWDRHGERPDRKAFLADLPPLARLRDWGVTDADVAERLPADPSFPEAVQAIYRAYADARGKPRFGDKTPSYMQELDLLERAFPGARYVHLIRDGRDAALSFVGLTRKPTFNLARPRGIGGFAVQWRREVEAARRFGRERLSGRYCELRYEDLVADPEPALRKVCALIELGYDPGMLAYHERSGERLDELGDLAPRGERRGRDEGERRAAHALASTPPTAARTEAWRTEMPPADREAFEAVAGGLLSELGYFVPS